MAGLKADPKTVHSRDDAGVLCDRVVATALTAFLEQQDDASLRRLLVDIPQDSLHRLLKSDNVEHVRLALLALSVGGHPSDTQAVANVLQHQCYALVSLAETTLWSIWLHAASDAHVFLLNRAIERAHEGDFDRAEAVLDWLIRHDHAYTEALHQRALLYFQTERYERAILDCHRVLVTEPRHFEAAALLGRSHLILGHSKPAIDAFQQALNIHPRMRGVRQLLRAARENKHNSGAGAPPRANHTTPAPPALEEAATGPIHLKLHV